MHLVLIAIPQIMTYDPNGDETVEVTDINAAAAVNKRMQSSRSREYKTSAGATSDVNSMYP